MEDETIAPGNNGTSQWSVRETIASNEKGWTRGEKPEEGEVEDSDIVTQVK